MTTTTPSTEKRVLRPRRPAPPAAAADAEPPSPPAKRQKPSPSTAGSSRKGKSKARSAPKAAKPRGSKEEEDEEASVSAPKAESPEENLEAEDEVEEGAEGGGLVEKKSKAVAMKMGVSVRKAVNEDDDEDPDCFLGEPVPEEEAKKKWPHRYTHQSTRSRPGNSARDEELRVMCHYNEARVDGVVYKLDDNAYVKAGEGEPHYIGRIVEFFETIDRKLYFTAQWFFRVRDTVIKDHPDLHVEEKRVFLSEEKNDNLLNCIVSKIDIVRVAPNVDLEGKRESIPPCDLYYDMAYCVEYSSFLNLPLEDVDAGSGPTSVISSERALTAVKGKSLDDSEASSSGQKADLSLLDLYSGCGAMSTGLCLGANLSGLSLQTRWAVDINSHALDSLKFNHPQVEVRNEDATNFLALLREWEKLCNQFDLGTETSNFKETESSSDDEVHSVKIQPGEFEVAKLVGICFGDPSKTGNVGLKFKVRWKGYGHEEDTWEPIEGLSNCRERIENFVRQGYRKSLLPLPGSVDVICGGPPCQGISGFNRFRDAKEPLKDPKNQQLVVFMDIVAFLKPKYVLMENVVDILKFASGFLGRYALNRLVSLNYQARLGIMAAGSYGLPQFRMRVFLWGAHPSENLPMFPLPTHDVVLRGGVPNEFEENLVAYAEKQHRQLEKALLLGDAISDLPPVTNYETRDVMTYAGQPKTDFQRLIRLTRQELMNMPSDGQKSPEKPKLFDHKPLQLNDDDFRRVCRIPRKKGANFRDLPGVKVGGDNVVYWDPEVEREYLPSGKPLVPDYAMTFVGGKSSKPFGRLWWDETVPTVVTRAEPHNQVVLHPVQDRVLTIRENARLQGFPDYYKLCGPPKERYIQVGNAVAVPVSRALGFALGQAILGKPSDQHVFRLPPKFPNLVEEIVE